MNGERRIEGSARDSHQPPPPGGPRPLRSMAAAVGLGALLAAIPIALHAWKCVPSPDLLQFCELARGAPDGLPESVALYCRTAAWRPAICRLAEDSPPWLLLSGLAAVPVLLLTWFWRDQHKRADLAHGKERERLDRQQLQTAIDGQVTERFTRAVEQLGHPEAAIRLGGIYALERLSRDSEADRWTVVELLAAFVRERTAPDPLPATAPVDISAALTVLARRTPAAHDPDRIDLHGIRAQGLCLPAERSEGLRNADLRGATLERAIFGKAQLENALMQEAHLEHADFRGSNLRGAQLKGADLTAAQLDEVCLAASDLFDSTLNDARMPGTNFADASLQGARLRSASLVGATLSHANLENAVLDGANLTGARLVDANLSGASLAQASLTNADLTGADLTSADLSGTLLTRATYDAKTAWPGNFDPAQAGAVLIGEDGEPAPQHPPEPPAT